MANSSGGPFCSCRYVDDLPMVYYQPDHLRDTLYQILILGTHIIVTRPKYCALYLPMQSSHSGAISSPTVLGCQLPGAQQKNVVLEQVMACPLQMAMEVVSFHSV